MTLEDLIQFLCDESRSATPREVAITRAVLLAYEMGIAAGKVARTPNPSDILAHSTLRDAERLEALRHEVEGTP